MTLKRHYKKGDKKCCCNCIYPTEEHLSRTHSICHHSHDLAKNLGINKYNAGISHCWRPWFQGTSLCPNCCGDGIDKQYNLVCPHCNGKGIIKEVEN